MRIQVASDDPNQASFYVSESLVTSGIIVFKSREWRVLDAAENTLLERCLRWVLTRKEDRELVEKRQAEREHYSALANDLFAIHGVESVTLALHTVQVNKSSQVVWDELKPAIAEVARRHRIDRNE